MIVNPFLAGMTVGSLGTIAILALIIVISLVISINKKENDSANRPK